MDIHIQRIISAFFGLLCIIIGLSLPVIPFFTALFGLVLWVIQTPMIIGGGLNLLGLILETRSNKWGCFLIRLGSIIGILNLPNFLIFHSPKKSAPKDATSTLATKIWIFPVIMSYYLYAIFIGECPDRANIPLNWRGRFGLTFLDTLWDTDVFWGELWFNLLLVLMLSAIIIIRFPPDNTESLPISIKTVKKGFGVSLGIVFILVFAMGITWPRRFSIVENWYETQFAYQIPAWAPIIGLMGLVIYSIPIGHKSKLTPVPIVCLCIFTGIWIYLTTITNFHPHVLVNFGFTSYYVLTSFAYIICVIGFILRYFTHPILPPIKESKTRFLPWILIFFGGFALVLGFQLYNAYHVPLIGADTIFSFDMPWSWGIAHWPGYVFIIALTGTLVLGTHLFYKRKSVISNSEATPSVKRAISSRRSAIGIATCLMILILWT